MRYHTDGRTRVYKEFQFIPAVPYIEETTLCIVTGVLRRHHSTLLKFPRADKFLQGGLQFLASSPNVR